MTMTMKRYKSRYLSTLTSVSVYGEGFGDNFCRYKYVVSTGATGEDSFS